MPVSRGEKKKHLHILSQKGSFLRTVAPLPEEEHQCSSSHQLLNQSQPFCVLGKVGHLHAVPYEKRLSWGFHPVVLLTLLHWSYICLMYESATQGH